MPNEELQKRLNQMVDKAIKDLKSDIAKADHPITKLAIARHEGYGIQKIYHILKIHAYY